MQGSASVALHARVADYSTESLQAALEDGSVFDVASARGVSTLVPAADAEIFTRGTLPADEGSLRHRLRSLRHLLDASGQSATDALARAIDVAREALASGPLDIAGLSGTLTRALPELSPMCPGRCGVEHIHQALFDLVGVAGTWRRHRVDGSRLFTALAEPSKPRADARRELVRRYLTCHGPSTVPQFAEWCGINPADARDSLVSDETTEVMPGAYVLTQDLDRFEAPPPPRGVRLLPPRDPYLEGRDRATLVPDRQAQKAIWRAIPTLGVVLVDGDAVSTWKAKKTDRHLQLVLEPLPGHPAVAPTPDLEAEAHALAALKLGRL